MFIAMLRRALVVTIGGLFLAVHSLPTEVASLSCRAESLGLTGYKTEELRFRSSGSWALELGLRTCDSEVELISIMRCLPRSWMKLMSLDWQADCFPLGYRGSKQLILETIYEGYLFPDQSKNYWFGRKISQNLGTQGRPWCALGNACGSTSPLRDSEDIVCVSWGRMCTTMRWPTLAEEEMTQFEKTSSALESRSTFARGKSCWFSDQKVMRNRLQRNKSSKLLLCFYTYVCLYMGVCVCVSIWERGGVSQVGLGCVFSLGQRWCESCSLEEHMGRTVEAGWKSATERVTYEEHVCWAHARSAYWAGLAFSQHPRTPQRYLVHVRRKQCLPDVTSVNVDLPVTRWETRESGSESLLSSYPSRAHLTHCQTLKWSEFQVHSRREQ